MDYSYLKTIRLEIDKCGLKNVEESFMTSILIKGMPLFYQKNLETLQITNKMENQAFDSLSDLLIQYDKTFGKMNTYGKDLLFTNSGKGAISIGRGTYNKSTRGMGTYNITSIGRGTHNESLEVKEDSIIKSIFMVLVETKEEGILSKINNIK